MIGKFVALAFASPFLLSNAQETTPVYVDVPQVRQVICDGSRGTAFRTGINAFTTARHVTHGTYCEIDGEPVNVTWESEELDMAVIRTSVPGIPLKINCDGYKDGQGYAGIGYAKGLPVQQAVFVTFSAVAFKALPAWGRFVTLIGDRFIPGQSGGISINKWGEVVGIVNGYNSAAPLSYSLPLSETPLCSGQQ